MPVTDERCVISGKGLGRHCMFRIFFFLKQETSPHRSCDLSPTVLRDLRGLPSFATSICQCVVNGRQDTVHVAVADCLTSFEMAEVDRMPRMVSGWIKYIYM